MQKRALSLVVVVCVIALGSGAHAQDRPSIEIARSHMEQGQAYYLQGRFGEAAAEFEAAYEAEPFSAFLYNAAVAYENGGDATRAVELFQRYLERDPSASDRTIVEQRIERLRAAIESARAARGASGGAETAGGSAAGGSGTDAAAGAGADTGGGEGASGSAAAVESAGSGEGAAQAAGITAGSATPPPEALPQDFKSLVSVRTTPEGATVIITGEAGEVARGYSPFSYTLERGSYHVRIEHPDFNVADQDVTVEPGHVYVILVNLSQGEFLGYLRVITQPPGAQIFVDDRTIGMRGQTPYEASFPVGAHHLWIERPGYQTVERDVEIGLASEVDVRVELERVAVGRVRVLSNLRGARVRIDGRYVGVVPYEGEVPAGSHQLRVEGEGMKAFERTIEIQRGQLTPVRVRLRPDVGRGGGWVAGTFAVLVAGGGVTMALIADDMRRQLEFQRSMGTLASDDDRLETGFYLSIAADAAFGLAAILGILSIYYFAYDPLPPSDGTVLEPRDWALAPYVDPRDGAGVAIGGRF